MTEAADTLLPDVLDPSQAVARHPSGWWKHRDGSWISPTQTSAAPAES